MVNFILFKNKSVEKLKFDPIVSFKTGKGYSHRIYCQIAKAAMGYKYKDFKGLYVALDAKELLKNPIFSFKESDKILLVGDRVIDGKKFRELFITTLFICYLDHCERFDDFEIKGKRISVGFPEIDRGVDTVVCVHGHFSTTIKDNKISLRVSKKSTISFQIQVKIYFVYDDFLADLKHPKAFDLNQLNPAKMRSYEDIILIYIATFTKIVFKDLLEEIEKSGLNKKRIILVGMVAGADFPRDYTFWDLLNNTEFKTAIPDCNFLLKSFAEITGMPEIKS